MNDIGKRLSRLGKDKLDSASEWINDAANPDGVNLRGAGAGAVVGGIVAGPLGAIVGAAIGKNAGANKANKPTPDTELTLLMQDVESSIEMNKANYEMTLMTRENLFAKKKKLNAEAEDNYAKAKARMVAGDEDGARSFLTVRQQALDQLALVEKEEFITEETCRQFAAALRSLEDQRSRLLEGLQSRD